MEITSQSEKASWLQKLPSRLLGQAAALVSREIDRALSDSGAHRHQIAVLATLEEFGQSSQAELCRRTDLDRSDMNAIVNTLGKAGFVIRSPNPDNRRENIISLTTAGSERFAELKHVVESAQARTFSCLGEVGTRELVDLLDKLHKHLTSD